MPKSTVRDTFPLGMIDALSRGVTMDKLLRVLLWVVVALAPGGLLLLPVLAYRVLSHRQQDGLSELGPASTSRLALPPRSA